MRILYSVIFLLFLPLIRLRFWWRARRLPAYNQRFNERLGLIPKLAATNVIWVHAVSVGEFISARPLIQQLLQRYPDYRIVVTTTTPTGSARVQQDLGDQVLHYYLPLDVPFAVKNFFAALKPKLGIIMETELWPNLLHYARKAKVKLILANARISPQSLPKYLKVKFMVTAMLAYFDLILVQSPQDLQRFALFEPDADKLQYFGNIKFTMPDVSKIKTEAQQLKDQIGSRFIWIAGSTHSGEEEIMLAAHQQILAAIPEALLVLVPRHPDRFTTVTELAAQQFSVTKRSTADFAKLSDTQVLLGDTMGELRMLFAMSDVAIVAGSFANIGGHNMLEPAQLSVPIITGPVLFNFADISADLIAADGMLVVNNADELASQIIKLQQQPERAKQLVANAWQIVTKNADALEQYLAVIDRALAG